MPVYALKCDSEECDWVVSAVVLTLKEKERFKCPKCGSSTSKDWSQSTISFKLEGSGWTSKNLRLKGEMERKNIAAASREADEWGTFEENTGRERGSDEKDSWFEDKLGEKAYR